MVHVVIARMPVLRPRGRRLLVVLLGCALAVASLPGVDARAESLEAALPRAATAAAQVWEPGAVNAAPTDGAPVGPPPASVLQEPSVVGEVAELRTPASRTFRREDGSFLTEVAAAAPDGIAPPEQAPPRALRADGAGGLVADRGAPGVRLPQRLADGRVEVADQAGRRLTFALAGAAPTARADARPASGGEGPVARYDDALPGVDVELEVQAGRVKEDLVLDGPSAARSFAYEVSAPGLSATLQDDGSVVLRDGEGAPAFVVEAPFAVDAAGARTEDVAVGLSPTPGGWELTYALADGWADAPDRAWPVTVDPTAAVAGGQYDACQISAGVGDRDGEFTDDWLCYFDTLWAGLETDHQTGQTSRVNRALLSFDIDAAISVPAQVESAELRVTNDPTQSSSGTTAVAVHRLTEGFDGAQVTWGTRSAGTPWTTPGGTFDAEPADVDPAFGEGGARANRFHVAGVVQGWLDGEANNGLLLKNVDETTPHTFAITAAGPSAPADATPALVIGWAPLVGVEDSSTLESFDLGSDRTVDVNVVSGNAMIRETDMTLPGRGGFDLELSRTWNSLLVGGQWGFGDNWSSTLSDNARIFVHDADRAVTYRDPDSGYKVAFTRAADGTWRPARRMEATLTRDAGGGWLLDWHRSGGRYRFYSWGQLDYREDRNGNRITFNYGYPDGHYAGISEVVDSKGRVTTIERDPDNYQRITAIIGPAGHTHAYGSGAPVPSSMLDTSTDPAGGTVTYDERHVVRPDGSREDVLVDENGDRTLLVFNPEQGYHEARLASLTRVTDAVALTGPTWQFAYDDTAGTTVVTDPEGHATTYHYDDAGRVTKVVDALGRERSTSYTATGAVGELGRRAARRRRSPTRPTVATTSSARSGGPTRPARPR